MTTGRAVGSFRRSGRRAFEILLDLLQNRRCLPAHDQEPADPEADARGEDRQQRSALSRVPTAPRKAAIATWEAMKR
jgi:hypothetical protein